MNKKFGKYEVVRKIGSGGFGSVYEARDPAIGRRVAIKTCLAQNEENRQRFIQEAQLAGNLHHRNLTTIYDFGSEGELLYLVFEFLPGEDLDVLIDSGRRLSTRERVEILIGIAYGLGHAHDFGVVHRDVKPANVRILPDGTVKIMDFGIAKFLYSERTLTKTGFTVGTSAYLAPEQVRGEPVDRRTDIFSYGVLAYELLSSRKPFSRPSQAAVLDAIVKEQPPPLGQVAPELPPALAQLVERAMRKEPDRRYPSMEPIRRELLAIRQELIAFSPPAAVPKDTDLAEATLPPSGVEKADPAPSSPDAHDLPDDSTSETSARRSRGWIVGLAIVLALAVVGALILWLE